jgi:hypothetical protein
MPANYQSRLPSANTDKISEITDCFDPFQPDMCDLQKADKYLQHMNYLLSMHSGLTICKNLKQII